MKQPNMSEPLLKACLEDVRKYRLQGIHNLNQYLDANGFDEEEVEWLIANV